MREGASLLGALPDLLRLAGEDARRARELCGGEEWMQQLAGSLAAPHEAALGGDGGSTSGALILGDNATVIAQLLAARTSHRKPNVLDRPRLVYLDPPFASAADYRSRIRTALTDGTVLALEHLAYSDRWDGITNYLRMLATRLLLVRELLAEDGAVCVHVDWHASHWVRLLLDEIFGAENFVNHLVWSYRSGGASRTGSVPRKHDDLLVYRRGPDFRVHPLYERQYLQRPFIGSMVDAQGRPYVDTILRDVLEGTLTLVDGAQNAESPVRELSVRPVLNVSGERTGYATQKPEGLLEVLLRWFTLPGDLVIDPFGGSGTTALVAARLHRRWLSIDANPQAIVVARARADAAGMHYLLADAAARDSTAVPYRAAPGGITAQPAQQKPASTECVAAAEISPIRNAMPAVLPEASRTARVVRIRLCAAPCRLPDTLRPARGAPTDAVARVSDDPLAHLAGWAIITDDRRIVSTWRLPSGGLQTELSVPLGVCGTRVELEVTDLVGTTLRVPLADALSGCGDVRAKAVESQ